MPKSRNNRKRVRIQRRDSVANTNSFNVQIADEMVQKETEFGKISVKTGRKNIIYHGLKKK